MSITIYTLPSCVQCDSTKRYLSRNNVEFQTVDLSTDERAMNMVKALGYISAPVVVSGDEHWSGFRIDRLNGLVEREEAA